MARSSNNAGVWGRVFLILFIISTLLFITFWLTGPMVSEVLEAIDPNASPNPPVTPNAGSYIAVIGTVLTSVTSLVGFITTNAIAWRKEKREAALAEIERKKLEIELEKSRLEIERLKEDKAKKNN